MNTDPSVASLHTILHLQPGDDSIGCEKRNPKPEGSLLRTPCGCVCVVLFQPCPPDGEGPGAPSSNTSQESLVRGPRPECRHGHSGLRRSDGDHRGGHIWSSPPDGEATGFHEVQDVLTSFPGSEASQAETTCSSPPTTKRLIFFLKLLLALDDSLQWWIFTCLLKSALSLELANRGLDMGKSSQVIFSLKCR